MRYTLGIELSTQSAKAVVLNADNGTIVHTSLLEYDKAFPSYGTVNGVLPNADTSIRRTSPRMLIEALDGIFAALKMSCDLTAVGAIKIDGMQHCTVYANGTLSSVLASLPSADSLVGHIAPALTRTGSPIWEDRSTRTEASALADALSAYGGIEKVTANAAELRFPASQIMKWAKENRAEYDATAHIMLLSAFATSILAGKIAPVDTGDGWGTNINTADIAHPAWDVRAVNAVESYADVNDLLPKLGAITHYDEAVGVISPYFTKKYGINSSAIVLAGTGDNPATLLGAGGSMVISLGSSYTVNGAMSPVSIPKDRAYNVFGFTKGNAMALTCFTNGGKLHEEFVKRYVSKGVTPSADDWKRYASLCGGGRLRADEPLMLPYLFDESVPVREAGIVRDGFSDADAAINIRALPISQALSLAMHSSHVRASSSFAVVGGGAKNVFLRQCISDMFNAETYCIDNASIAAPLGCAVAAAKQLLGISYEEAFTRYVTMDEKTVLRPSADNSAACTALMKRYRELGSASK